MHDEVRLAMMVVGIDFLCGTIENDVVIQYPPVCVGYSSVVVHVRRAWVLNPPCRFATMAGVANPIGQRPNESCWPDPHDKRKDGLILSAKCGYCLC